MKKNIISLFVIITIASCNSSSNVKEIHSYYENGNIESQGVLLNNKKTGVWIFYNEDGGVSSKQIYEDGKLCFAINSVFNHDEDENNTHIYFYKNGKLNGPSLTLDSKDQLKQLNMFKNGTQFGYLSFFNSEGRILNTQNFHYNKNTKEYYNYHLTGFLKNKTLDFNDGNTIIDCYDSLGKFIYKLKMENYQPVDTIRGGW